MNYFSKKEKNLFFIIFLSFLIFFTFKVEARTYWNNGPCGDAEKSGCSCPVDTCEGTPTCKSTDSFVCPPPPNAHLISNTCLYDASGNCNNGISCQMGHNDMCYEAGVFCSYITGNCAFECDDGWDDIDYATDTTNDGCEHPTTNYPPEATSLSTNSNSVKVGRSIIFSGYWTDSNTGQNGKIYVCKSDSFTAPATCNDGEWCHSENWQSEPGPNVCSYTAEPEYEGTIQQYWLGVCDDQGACDPLPIGPGTFRIEPACHPDGCIKTSCAIGCTFIRGPDFDPDCGCSISLPDGCCPDRCTIYDDIDCTPVSSPPTVRTLSAEPFTYAQAFLSGFIDSCPGKCNWRGFEWRKDTDSSDTNYGCRDDFTNCESGLFDPGAFSKQISVSPETTYIFKAKAHNSAGGGEGSWARGNPVTFTTPGLPPVSQARFQRKIMITKDPTQPDRITVQVVVSWKDKNGEHTFTTQEYLYNWY